MVKGNKKGVIIMGNTLYFDEFFSWLLCRFRMQQSEPVEKRELFKPMNPKIL